MKEKWNEGEHGVEKSNSEITKADQIQNAVVKSGEKKNQMHLQEQNQHQNKSECLRESLNLKMFKHFRVLRIL